jgi:hypothetical protein
MSPSIQAGTHPYVRFSDRKENAPFTQFMKSHFHPTLHDELQIGYGEYTGTEKECGPQKHIWLD